MNTNDTNTLTTTRVNNELRAEISAAETAIDQIDHDLRELAKHVADSFTKLGPATGTAELRHVQARLEKLQLARAEHQATRAVCKRLLMNLDLQTPTPLA